MPFWICERHDIEVTGYLDRQAFFSDVFPKVRFQFACMVVAASSMSAQSRSLGISLFGAALDVLIEIKHWTLLFRNRIAHRERLSKSLTGHIIHSVKLETPSPNSRRKVWKRFTTGLQACLCVAR